MQKPSFDTWTSIFLLAALQGIFVASVLWFANKENRFNNGLLALLILLFSFTLIDYVLFWTKFNFKFPRLFNLSNGFPFLFGVVLFFYFRNVFESKRFSGKDLLHLLPFFLFMIIKLPEYLSSPETKQKWMQGGFTSPDFNWFQWERKFWPFWPWVKITHMSIYAALTFFSWNNLSKTNPEVRTWFKWITGLFAAFVLSFTSYYVLVRFPFFNVGWDYMISFSMMFFIYFIAWFGYMQPKIFSGLRMTETAKANGRYKNSALTPELSRELLLQLQKTMDEKKLYRQNDLRLEKLASEMNVSRHHLSQLLNEQAGMNFFEYINHLRIHEAKQLLGQTSKKELNIIDVAYTVGFNNKVSFNTTFKKITGKTPTEFRKELKEGKDTATFQ
jgi:AraC-like DNA-binding protein